MKQKTSLIIVFFLLFFFFFERNITLAQPQIPIVTKYEAVASLLEYFKIPLNPDYTVQPPIFIQYWRDVWPANPYYKYINTACEIQLIQCNKENFYDGEGAVSLPVFLKMFYTLKYRETPSLFSQKFQYEFTGEWYVPYVSEAKKTNNIPFNSPPETVSFAMMKEIFRRADILTFYDGILDYYFEGLEMDVNKVTTNTYYSLQKVQTIISQYQTIFEKIERMRNEEKQGVYKDKIETLNKIQEAFILVKTELEKNPLFYDPTVPSIVKELAQQYGIKEKIGESFYDYSKSASYRKFNIKTALNKIHGTVLQPGEEFNFANIVYDQKLRDFKMGWVISKGKEVMAVGGGICGAATTVFEAAYRSGLNITERKAHSIFYRSFYSMDKIGLDATVYYPRPNLRFVNNTQYPLILALDFPSPYIANFQVWGVKHFDNLTLEGPNLQGKTTRWVRTIWMKNGDVVQDELKSSFGKIL